jgi:methyl-accepting chemotaxis protein
VWAAGAAVLILCGGAAGAGLWVTSSLTAALTRSAASAHLLRSHMEADQFHDALRGDVLAILHSDDPTMGIPLAAAQKELADDQAGFRRAIQGSEGHVSNPEVRDALSALKTPLDNYIDASSHIARLQETDPIAAEHEYAGFKARFEELEVAMAKASDRIEAASAAD